METIMRSKIKRFAVGALSLLMVASNTINPIASTWIRQPNTNNFVLNDVTTPNYVNFRGEKMWFGDFKENADGSGRDVSSGSKLLMENMSPQKFYNFVTGNGSTKGFSFVDLQFDALAKDNQGNIIDASKLTRISHESGPGRILLTDENPSGNVYRYAQFKGDLNEDGVLQDDEVSYASGRLNILNPLSKPLHGETTGVLAEAKVGTTLRLTNVGYRMTGRQGEPDKLYDLLITIKSITPMNAGQLPLLRLVNTDYMHDYNVSSWDAARASGSNKAYNPNGRFNKSPQGAIGIWFYNTEYSDFTYRIVDHGAKADTNDDIINVNYFWDIDNGQYMLENHTTYMYGTSEVTPAAYDDYPVGGPNPTTPAGNHYIDPELSVNYVNDKNPNMFGQVFSQSSRYKSTPDNDSNGNQLEFFRDNAAYLSVGMFSNIINGDSHRFNVEYGTAAYDGDKGTNAGDPYGSYWDAGTANREFFPSGNGPANKGLNMTNWIRSLGKFKHWSTADVNHALNSKRGQERYAPFLGKNVRVPDPVTESMMNVPFVNQLYDYKDDGGIWYALGGYSGRKEIPLYNLRKQITDLNETATSVEGEPNGLKPELRNHLGLLGGETRTQKVKLMFDAGWSKHPIMSRLIIKDNFEHSNHIKYVTKPEVKYIKNGESTEHIMTDYFNIEYTKNGVMATLKADKSGAYVDRDAAQVTDALTNSTVWVEFNIEYTDWAGSDDEVKTLNKFSVTTASDVLESTPVGTIHPQDGRVEKFVSAISNGVLNDASYVPAETKNTAVDIIDNENEYWWKVKYTLPNYISYQNITLNDDFDNMQTISEADVKVYDSAGNDITAQGTITITPPAIQMDRRQISWTANENYLRGLNGSNVIGRNDKVTAAREDNGEHQIYYMVIRTDVKNATDKQRADRTVYYVDGVENANPAEHPNGKISSRTFIQNVGSFSVRDNSGSKEPYVKTSNPSWVSIPAKPRVTKKFVVVNERLDSENEHTGINNEGDYNVNYDIYMDVTAGSRYDNKYFVIDYISPNYTYKGFQVWNGSHQDVTDLFYQRNVDGTLQFNVKDDALGDVRLMNTTLRLMLYGTFPRTIKQYDNTVELGKGGIWGRAVATHRQPGEGSVVKKVSGTKNAPTAETGLMNHFVTEGNLDNYTGFELHDTPADALRIPHFKNRYAWQNTFTLPERLQIGGITLTDYYENIQDFKESNFKIYYKGNDVTAQGTITKTDDRTSDTYGSQTFNYSKANIVWTANRTLVDTINADYGEKSDEHPTLEMRIETNIENSTREMQDYYTNKVTGALIIPNKAKMDIMDTKDDTTPAYTRESNLSHVTFPSNIEPFVKKKVSDKNEIKVDANNVGLNFRDVSYDVSTYVSGGYKVNKLIFEDNLPAKYTTAVDKVSVHNDKNEDLTALFDITIDGNNKLTATLKQDGKSESDPRLMMTNVTLHIEGTYPQWVGEVIPNEATKTDDYYTNRSNVVTTTIPSEPKSIKEVSVDGGKTFNLADTSETASEVANRGDVYTWKVTHTLPNYTEFTAITLEDIVDNIQNIPTESIKVYDFRGQDVTKKGTLVHNDATITWTADRAVYEDVNANFGPKSSAKPVFTMTFDADIKQASNADEALRFNAKVGKVVIENNASQTVADVLGNVKTSSNPSHVTFPKPGEPTIQKSVSKAGANDWHSTLVLDEYDGEYDYRVKFTLSKNQNFTKTSDLILSDLFENVQSFREIKILDDKLADITDQFNLSTLNVNDNQVYLYASPKNPDDFDDTGRTLYMQMNGVFINTPDGARMSKYIDLEDSPFKEGITIPNIARIVEDVPIVPFKRQKDSNKTYVNVVVEPDLVKWVEDDNMEVFDPKTATVENSDKKQLIGVAQYLMSELVKKNPKLISSDKYYALQKDLLNPNVTVQELLNHIGDVYKTYNIK